MSHIDSFNEILSGKRQPPLRPQARTPTIGSIVEVNQTTALVNLPDFDKTHSFGPYPFSATGSPPNPGDDCLVVFSGNDISKGWIVGWNSGS